MKYKNICPIMDKEMLSLTRYSDVFSSLKEYQFKFEIISSPVYNEILGYEILLDFENAKKNSLWAFNEYKKSIYDMSAIEFTIDKLLANEIRFNPQRLFINFERNHLCNRMLLQRVVLLSKELFLNDIELVLEITERNICGKCWQVLSGLNFLKVMGVALAIDDYDIYEGDFRTPEVLSGIYSYVKIEMPIGGRQRELFNMFSMKKFTQEGRGMKIIIEKVENIKDVDGLVKPFGLQGFFNKNN